VSKTLKSTSLETAFLSQENDTIRLVFVAILTLILTFVLIFLEQTILPLPWFLEELAKALVIFYLILPIPGRSSRLLGALVFVLVFTLSENIFYFLNFVQQSSIDQYLWRFIWPTLMHMLTVFLILFFSWRDRRLVFVAMIITMMVHYLYNTQVVGYFSAY
jgi:hypothetical protein